MSILDDTYHDRIEAYLLGELSEEERKAFQDEMVHNVALRDAVVEMGELQADMKALERDDFLGRLNEIRGELEEGKDRTESSQLEEGNAEKTESSQSQEASRETREGKIRTFPRMYFAAAAVILLLIVPLYFVLRPNPTLVEQYFEPYENLYSSRGSIDVEIKQALADYDGERYSESIVHFDAYLEAVPSDSEAVFYAGVAHLAAGETGDAITLLSSVQTNGFIYSLRAKWYLALAYLQVDRKIEAKKLLEELKESGFSLKDKVSNLLEELSSGT